MDGCGGGSGAVLLLMAVMFLACPVPGRRSRGAAVVALVSLLACTPAARGGTALGVGAAACGVGHAASLAGQTWGQLLAAAGCWLAEWGSGAIKRTREAEAAAAGLERAAEAMRVHPCEADADRLREALAECEQAKARGE